MDLRKILLALTLLVLIAGCTSDGPSSVTENDPTKDGGDSGWRDATLTDVMNREEFSIGGYAGAPILIETFAVWCPTCLKQQKEIKKLVDGTKITDEVVRYVSLDIDPNEDASIISQHVGDNGFTWNFAISPSRMTRSLVEEFGAGIVSAPQSPIVLVCPDQSARLLRRGLKTAEELRSEIARGC